MRIRISSWLQVLAGLVVAATVPAAATQFYVAADGSPNNAGSPIIVRQVPNERATIDCARVTQVRAGAGLPAPAKPAYLVLGLRDNQHESCSLGGEAGRTGRPARDRHSQPSRTRHEAHQSRHPRRGHDSLRIAAFRDRDRRSDRLQQRLGWPRPQPWPWLLHSKPIGLADKAHSGQHCLPALPAGATGVRFVQ